MENSPPVDPQKLTVRDRLLLDSISVFRALDAHWLPVDDVLVELLKRSNWKNFGNGRGLTSHVIVRYLKDMEVSPGRQTWHDGKKRSGYRRDDLIACWDSWFGQGDENG